MHKIQSIRRDYFSQYAEILLGEIVDLYRDNCIRVLVTCVSHAGSRPPRAARDTQRTAARIACSTGPRGCVATRRPVRPPGPTDTSPGTDRPPRRRRSTGVDGDALSLWQAAAIAIAVIVAIVVQFVVASGGVLSTADGSGPAPVRGLLGEGAAGAEGS